ncbi:MAG TPA: RES family NAD+ phosphorylase [Steroidobacteraceae bacterium]|nr:RES family NAD+ phosphorylase [Steroidobacteraceae bacterium]
MSSNIWTPPAVGSEASRATRRLWRAVEAQHVASTLRLVANVEEQLLLERILERSKPALPQDAADLHYLLATPFRYVSPIGSRFRAPADAGVWYGAERERTACAELGFWRWRFLMESAGLESLGPSPQTVFRAGIDGRMVDLTAAPFKRARSDWTDPNDYTASQRFARVARQAGMDAIRYESVRDPEHAGAVAVLSPSCFKPRQPLDQRIWLLTVRPEAAIWQREGQSHEFLAKDWRR